MDSISSDGHTLSNHGPLQLPSSLIMTSGKVDGSGIFPSSAFDRRKRGDDDDDDDDDEISNSETGTTSVQSILQKTLMDESLLRLEKHDDFSALVKQALPPPSLSRQSSTGSRSSMSRSGAAAQRRLQMAISSTTARMADLEAGEMGALSALSRSFEEEDEGYAADDGQLILALSEALGEALIALPKPAHSTRPRAMSEKDRRKRLERTIHSLTRENLNIKMQEYQNICNVAKSRPTFDDEGGLSEDELADNEEFATTLKTSASVTYTTQSSSPASASPSLPLSRSESSLVDEEEERPGGGLYLEQCAKEGIDTAEADAARLLCERLEEYHWQRGHERQAEAAALAAGEIKKGGDYGPDGSHRRVQGDGKKMPGHQNKDNTAGGAKGPNKITLPPSMAAKAQSLQDNLKKDTVAILRNAEGDSTNPRFASSLKVLSSIYKGRGCDARAVSSEERDEALDPVVSSTIEGSWDLISKPTYPDCLGRNEDGDFMYTLARVSFSMLSPGDLVCSIQRLRHEISLVAMEDDQKFPDVVPRKLRDALENGPYRNGLRKYDIVVNITIEPQDTDGRPEAEGQDGMPQSKLHAIMSNSGYMLPDSTTDNRFQVWFTGGSLRPAEGVDMEAWSDVFHQDRRDASCTLGDRAKVLAAKLLLGAEIPHGMGADGSMSYHFHRPIPGHIDVLYTDGTLQVLKGNRGSIMVQSRAGICMPHAPKQKMRRRVSTSKKEKVEARVA